MKDQSSINENELDAALNALFLETYSLTEDEHLARFVLDQEYAAVMTDKKKKKLFTKLKKRRGKSFLLLALIGLVVTIVLPVYLYLTDTKSETHFPPNTPPKVVTLPQENTSNKSQITEAPVKEDTKTVKPRSLTPPLQANNSEIITANTIATVQPESDERKEPGPDNKKKPLPYFDIAGLEYFQMVKDNLLLTILKQDNQLYTRMDPGSTLYKNREVLVAPFVMSNFPVTNLQYKAFLADLFRHGKMNDLEKCLPKQNVWNEYNCSYLAENYFNSESYNHFPVVNIGKEAIVLFCNWMEEEMNKKLATPKFSRSKTEGKKKEVIVRLPYDYEWIYAADASYAIIPDCGGYNTIYDPSEGLVNNSFFKRTSQLSKRKKKNMNRIDQLNDLNRFGMTENEMIAIYKEAMSISAKKSGTDDPSFSRKVEDLCLAGHVVELINTREGGTTLRGCCWKNKEDYLKMAGDYKKSDASPFVGFRVVFVTKNGTYKDPFW